MTRMVSALPMALALGVLPASTSAQALTQEDVIKGAVEAGVKTARLATATETVRQPFAGVVSANAEYGEILTLVLMKLAADEGQDVKRRAAYKALLDVMAVRVDTQVGSTSQSEGSTSLAMKGTVPAILGFGVEHGALTRDVNGTVATFRFSPPGLARALQGEGLLDIYKDYEESAGFRFASRFSLSASFDTSRGDTPNTLLANEQQLSAWSASVVLFNNRDPRRREYQKFWNDLADDVQAYTSATRHLRDALARTTSFRAWHDALMACIKKDVDDPLLATTSRPFLDSDVKKAAEAMTAILIREIEKLNEPPVATALKNAISGAELGAALDNYVATLKPVVDFRNNVYEYALKGSLSTFDWTTSRDPNLPDLYTLTGVYETSFGTDRKTDFTANVAIGFYGGKPTGSDHKLKDFALTAQLDKPLGSVFEIPFVFTASGKWQYIPNDTPVSAAALATGTDVTTATPTPPAGEAMATAMAPKGHLVVGQAKLTIPLKGGARIPISVTLANRTELITEKKVIARANFGVTFDLDAFAAAVKAR